MVLKSRTAGYAGRPPLRSGSHSPTGKPVEPCGILDIAEVKALLSVVENLKHRALLTITYSAGLRISEAACLRVTDIDSKRMMLRVQQGKGGKDR